MGISEAVKVNQVDGVVDMDKFFNPSSVVIFGASNGKFNLGAMICKALSDGVKYQGRAYAVNSAGEDVAGTKGFKSLEDIQDDIDLAVIITPASVIPGLIRKCGEKGIRNVIIESAGFSEKGEEGKKLQKEINRLARFFSMRIIGPNCLGIVDVQRRFCCMYGAEEIVPMLIQHPGPVSYILQSGGVAELVAERMMDDRMGVNKMVCIGNKSDVDEADLIDYFSTDNTDVICVYLENVKDGRKLMSSVKKTRKPVLVYKSGRSEAGSAATMSHTAGMAQNDAVFDGACRQAGIIRLQSIEELHSLPKMFTRMPLLSGNRIAVFTTSGAFGSVGADLLANTELVMAEFSEETKSRLSRIPGVFNATNPVDIGPAPPEIYLEIYNILLTSGEVDGMLHLAGIWRDFVKDVMQALVNFCQRQRKPAALYVYNSMGKLMAARDEQELPVFYTAEEAVRALEVSYQQYRYLNKKEEPLWRQ